MGEASEIQLQIMGQEDQGGNPVEQTNGSSRSMVTSRPRSYSWWLRIALYTFFVLAGLPVGVLLARLYYEKGGNSRWMITLVQTAGFPVLIPLYYFSSYITSTNISSSSSSSSMAKPPSVLVLSAIYIALGVLLAAYSLLYSIGLLNLPVSTYSLITASTQLAFNALFSFFINSQKFTPFIVNSLFLLTISSTLLVFQNGSSDSKNVSKGKYVIGFVCTVAASAGYGLLLSLSQFCFEKVFKKQTFKVVLDMIIYQSLVATLVILIGLFASGDWGKLHGEMAGFELGKVSYVNVLVWIAISLQVFSVGSMGLIFEVSSLFSNVIGTLALPVVPVLAVVFFHDKMSGVKVISMLLAVWGFASYIYQHYLDDRKSKTTSAKV